MFSPIEVVPADVEKRLSSLEDSRTNLSEDLRDNAILLARIISMVAHISNLEECTDLSLRMITRREDFPAFLCREFFLVDGNPTLQETDIFCALASMVSEDIVEQKLPQPFREAGMTTTERNRKGSEGAWLWSDFGWSIYLDIVGDKDSAEVRPELVHVKPAVPTHVQTGER